MIAASLGDMLATIDPVPVGSACCFEVVPAPDVWDCFGCGG